MIEIIQNTPNGGNEIAGTVDKPYRAALFGGFLCLDIITRFGRLHTFFENFGRKVYGPSDNRSIRFLGMELLGFDSQLRLVLIGSNPTAIKFKIRR